MQFPKALNFKECSHFHCMKYNLVVMIELVFIITLICSRKTLNLFWPLAVSNPDPGVVERFIWVGNLD